MTDLEILDIIPLDKYPSETPDSFSYFGNAPLYSLVKIPLRNKVKTGFVINKKTLKQSKLFIKQAEFNLKPIKSILTEATFISEKQVQFSYWLKNAHNISLSHAFYLLLQWHKKCAEITQIINRDAVSIPQKTEKQKLKLKDKTVLLKDLPLKLSKEDLPMLMIAPQVECLQFLKTKYPEAIWADLSLPPKKFQELIKKIYSQEKVLFIGGKNSIFLPWQKLNQIIIYEEGSIFYKESFRQPYFDYLNLIEKFAEIANIPIKKISPFPSLNNYIATNNISLPKLNFETIDNNIEAVENLLVSSSQGRNGHEQYKKIMIFSLQKITAQRLICESCRSEIKCPYCDLALVLSEQKVFCKSCFYEEKSLACKNCKNNEFQIRGAGAEWLAKYFKEQGLDIIFIKNRKDWKKIQKSRKFIIIGSQNLLVPNISEFDLLLFLNFDQAFQSYNIFMKEKILRILEFLARKSKKIILPTSLPPETLQKIKSGKIIDEILKEREQQFLPPYSRMIKLVSQLQNLQILNKRMIETRKEIEHRKINFKERIEIWGPFLKKIPKRMSRHQLELILRIDHKINLKKLLEGIRVDEIEVDSYSMD